MLRSKLFLFGVFLIILISCDGQVNRSNTKYIPNERVFIELLDHIEVYKNLNNKIHISIDEHLNDSSLIVNITQHGLEPSSHIELDDEFLYRDMKVYLYTKSTNSVMYVPDAKTNIVLLRYQTPIITFYELSRLSAIVIDTSLWKIDTTSMRLNEEDIF